MKKDDIIKILDRLDQKYPEAECELNHKNVFQLLIAVALSAQTTDKSVNRVTPDLFRDYPEASDLAKADPQQIEKYIHSIGMYRTKAVNIVGIARELTQKYDGEVPQDYDKLVALPGVGRKTANVVLSVGFGEQRIAVDTHVFRVSNRLGLVNAKNVTDTENELMRVVPKDRWTRTHHSLIFHGRYCCDARKPKCGECPVNELCKWYLTNKPEGEKK